MNTDSLYELVHSLTPNEKRYFKLFSQIQPGAKNYLRLFDAIEGTKEYDAKLIKAKLNGHKMNFSYEKKYLVKILMKSLRNFQDDDVPAHRVNSIMCDWEILMQKGFYEEARLVLDEGITLAQGNWKEPYLQLLVFLKGAVMRFSQFQNVSDQEMKNWDSQFGKALAEGNMVFELERLHIKMFHKYKKRNLTEEDSREMQEIVEHPLMLVDPETLSFHNHLLYLQIKSVYLQIVGGKNYREMAKQAELWQAEKEAQVNMPIKYMGCLHNAVIGYAGLGMVDKIYETIGLLENAKVFSAQQEREKQIYLLMVQFKLFDYLCVPDEASTWLNKNITRLEGLLKKVTVYERYLFLYQIGTFYMLDGNPWQAIDYFDRVNKATQAEPFIFYTYSLILTLAAHYDLGNYKLLPHMTRSMKRKLTKLDKFGVLEQAILAGFNKLALPETQKSSDIAIKNFQQRLDTLEYERNEYYKGVAKTINIWLKSKVAKQSMMAFVKQGHSAT